MAATACDAFGHGISVSSACERCGAGFLYRGSSTGERAVCTLCGASYERVPLLGGANGYLCFSCIADALRAVALAHHTKAVDTEPDNHSLTARQRCLICDEKITARRLVAHHHPFAICDVCLKAALDMVLEGTPGPPAPLVIVDF